MPLIRAQFVNLKYDARAHRKTLDEALQVQLRQAARAWLKATFIHIPLWTGEARGSLQPLARVLGVAIPLRPVREVRPGKDAASGAAQQHFGFTAGGGRYDFTWTTDVLHYQYNEFSPHPNVVSAPWHSTRYGEVAFRDYVSRILPQRIPKVTEFLTTTITREARV